MSLVDEVPHSSDFELLISEEQIRNKVRELGRSISEDYRGKCPILIGVLNGGFIFMADLIRELTIDCEVDFIKISSYGNERESSGKVRLLKDINCDVRGRDILVVEDIVDSGLSIKFLERRFRQLEPKSLRFVSLLVKQENLKVEVDIDYVGFIIPGDFVVGYGLDYAQKLRNLRAIYVMKP